MQFGPSIYLSVYITNGM